MSGSLRHIALIVPDLEEAEAYYRSLFGMQLIGREAEQDGLWYTLPFDRGWEDAHRDGIALGMVALRKGQIVLALFAGDAPPGQVFAIGLSLPPEEIAGIRARLSVDAELTQAKPDRLEFLDPYQILWQISTPGDPFRTAGDFAGRWIKV